MQIRFVTIPLFSVLSFCLFGVCFLLPTGPARACSTPVFRYALENWPADAYDVLVRGNRADQERIKAEMEAILLPDEGAPVNAYPRYLVDETIAPGAARMEIRFPYHPKKLPPVWEGAYSKATLQRLCDSPVREKLTKALLGDATAVFLFLESGKQAADQEARQRLRSLLDKLEKMIELPVSEDPLAMQDEEKEDTPAPPAIHFTILDIRRDDTHEAFLRHLLLATENDLATLDEPMTFPVFGRGRALYAIVGRGINQDVLTEACLFITGACSCQVKAQNPGVDLLLRASWDQIFEDMPYEEVELPPLTGVAPMVAAAEQGAAKTVTADETPSSSESVAAAPEAPAGKCCEVLPEADIPNDPVQQQPGNGMSRLTRIVSALLGATLLVLSGGTIWILLTRK